MRGGSINAAGDVKIYELGSVSGAVTLVSTSRENIINCEIAHINSTVKIGELSSKFDTSVKKVKAFYYKGELMIEKSNL
jgi:hypothetical protein